MSGDDRPLERPKHFDPTDVFSPSYEQHVAEAGAPPAGRPVAATAESAEPSGNAVLRGGFIASVVLGLALAATAIPLPQGGHVDTSVLLALNHLFAALPLKVVQFVAAELNLTQVALAAALVILWTSRKQRRRMRDFALLSVAAGIVVYAVSAFVNLAVHRPRPFFEVTLQPLVDPQTLDQVHRAITPVGPVLSDEAAIYALAALLAFTMSRRAGLIIALIGVWSVCYRIGSGLNWPSDALGGALFGTAVAVFAIRFRYVLDPWFPRLYALFHRHPATANAIAFIAVADFALGFPILKGLAQAMFR